MLIFALTLVPVAAGTEPGSAGPWCLGCGTFGTVDLILNVALFVPLGGAFGVGGGSARKALIAAMLTSALVECLQVGIVAGRDANVADVLMNSAGGVLGWMLGRHAAQLLDPAPMTARRLATVWALCWVATRVATTHLLQPSVTSAEWFAQVAPHDVYPADFGGVVLDARVDGSPIEPGSLGASPPLRRRIAEANTTVEATVREALPTSGLASIVSVLDANEEEILLLGHSAGAVRFRVRLRAADARLRVPSVGLAHTRPHGDTARTVFKGWLRNGRLEVSAASSDRTERSTLVLGAGLGWALILPADIAFGEGTGSVTALVTFLMLLPVAYWGWAGATVAHGSRNRWTMLIVCLIAGGLIAPPILMGAPRPEWTEWVGALLGSVSGAWCRGGLRHRRPQQVNTTSGG